MAYIRKKITKDDRDDADEHSKKINIARENSRPDFAGNLYESNYNGYLGELKVHELLEECFIRHKWYNDINMNDIGKGDRCDIVIYENTIPNTSPGIKIVDIKTRRIDKEKEFFIARQRVWKSVDIYIHVRLDKDRENAYIMGWMLREDIVNCSISDRGATKQNPAYRISISNLKPIHQLFEIMGYPVDMKKLYGSDDIETAWGT